MAPPSICMTRPMRSRDPGPSIPAAPGRCPLHQGQLGWNMQLPCDACISLAYASDVPFSSNYSPVEVSSPGISQGASSVSSGVVQQSAAPKLASSGTLERPSQGSDGVPPPPPPPPPIACFRHRGGGGGLCQTPVRLASSWPLMLTLDLFRAVSLLRPGLVGT